MQNVVSFNGENWIVLQIVGAFRDGEEYGHLCLAMKEGTEYPADIKVIPVKNLWRNADEKE